MSSVDEAVRYLQQAYDFVHSLDGYLIKLDTALDIVIDDDPELVSEFLQKIKEKGLLNKVACHKDDLDTVVTKSRFPNVYKYLDEIMDIINDLECEEPFSIKVPQPSRQANQMAWGREYRDVKIRKRRTISLKKIFGGLQLSPTVLLAISMLSSIGFFYALYFILKNLI